MGFSCTLASPAGVAFSGAVWQITVPGNEGRFSIRKDHIPLFSTLKSGTIEIALSDNDRHHFSIEAGIIEFRNNHCRIMAERINMQALQ